MVPNTVYCEDCGQISTVRGYGRVEYDWPKTSGGGQTATIPVIKTIRLTVDCPCCGVKTQDFWPDDPRRSAAGRQAVKFFDLPSDLADWPQMFEPRNAK